MSLAGADRRDPAYDACRELLETNPGSLLTVPAVLAETGWLLDRQLGPAAEAALYRSVADGEVVVEPSPALLERGMPSCPTSKYRSTGICGWRRA